MPNIEPVYQTQPRPPMEQLVVRFSRAELREIVSQYGPQSVSAANCFTEIIKYLHREFK